MERQSPNLKKFIYTVLNGFMEFSKVIMDNKIDYERVY